MSLWRVRSVGGSLRRPEEEVEVTSTPPTSMRPRRTKADPRVGVGTSRCACLIRRAPGRRARHLVAHAPRARSAWVVRHSGRRLGDGSGDGERQPRVSCGLCIQSPIRTLFSEVARVCVRRALCVSSTSGQRLTTSLVSHQGDVRAGRRRRGNLRHGRHGGRSDGWPPAQGSRHRPRTPAPMISAQPTTRCIAHRSWPQCES